MNTSRSTLPRLDSPTDSEWTYEYDPANSTTASSRSSSSASLKKPVNIPLRVVEALMDKDFAVDDNGRVTMGPNSRSHPRNWSIHRKRYDTVFIFFQEFWMTLISNTGTAVTSVAASELGIDQTAATAIFVTTYMMGQAIGSLIFPPLSETLGSKWIWVATCCCYTLFNLFIAIWPLHIDVVITFRILSGMASAIPATVACGSLENLWDAGARIFVIWAWICCAVFGLALAPVLTQYISMDEVLSWPFVFGLAAIVSFVSVFLSLLIKESRPEKHLENEVHSICRMYDFHGLQVETKQHCSWHERMKDFFRDSLKRPVILFFTEPIVATTSLMAAFVYGLVYLFTESNSIVYVEGFGLTPAQAAWTNMAFAVSIPITFLPRLLDRRVARKCRDAGKEMEPEQKLTGFYIAVVVLAIGLWLFGAFVHTLTDVSKWISLAMLVLVGYGVIEFDSVLSGYLTDCYNEYAASANAPLSFLRCLLSGTFPLFAGQMFRGMGKDSQNIAVFILAGCATVFCGIAAMFWRYSKILRKRSKFAEKTALSPSDSEQKLVEKEREVV